VPYFLQKWLFDPANADPEEGEEAVNFDFVTNATAKELEQFKSVCNQLLSRPCANPSPAGSGTPVQPHSAVIEKDSLGYPPCLFPAGRWFAQCMCRRG